MNSLLKANRLLFMFYFSNNKSLGECRTLPTYTLHSFILISETPKGIKNTIENIEEVCLRLGNNYLEVILKRVQNLKEDVIISIENQVKPILLY